MTWIKVEESIATPLRARIATITQCDFVNNTRRPVHTFFNMFQRGFNIETAEAIARECLEAMYQDAKHWTLLQIGFAMSRQAIEVVVQHSSFDVTPPGMELPRVVSESDVDAYSKTTWHYADGNGNLVAAEAYIENVANATP